MNAKELKNVPILWEIVEPFPKWKVHLHNANPNCLHNIVAMWSGVKCSKCCGWFCF